jgi:aminoglycoside phosphotransferase (APT) family kinase protein
MRTETETIDPAIETAIRLAAVNPISQLHDEPLDRWLDGEYARALLGPHLRARFGAPIASRGMRACDVRYKVYRKSPANTSLSVCYDVALAGENGARRVSRGMRVYARFYRPGGSTRALARDVPSTERSPPLHIVALDALLWVFPDDPGLPRLRELCDRHRIAELVPPSAWLGKTAPQGLAIEPINYRPGERFTARYTFTAPRGVTTLYGKTYADAVQSRLLERIEALRSAGYVGFEIPEAIGFTTTTNTLWLRGVAGPTLAECIGTRDESPHIEQMTRALLELHHSAREHSARLDLATISASDLLAEAAKKTEKLAQRLPAHCDAFARILDGLSNTMPSADTSALIHADCHAGQWIAGRERTTLVDLDELALGDPAQDLATFITDLEFRALSERDVQRVREQLLREYRRSAALDLRTLEWHLVVQRQNRMHRQLVQRRWRTSADALPMLARQFESLAQLNVRAKVVR